MDLRELSRRYARDKKAGRATKVRYVGENRDELVGGKVYRVVDIVFYDKVEVALTKNRQVVSSVFLSAEEIEDPVRKRLDIATGRIYEYDGGVGRRYAWSKQMLDDLMKYFHDTENRDMAHIVGVSVRTMNRKARELGLEKDPDFMKRVRRRNAQIGYQALKEKGYPGRFKKGHAPTKGCFPKGKIPPNRKEVIRMDTGERYESIRAFALVMGVAEQSVSSACVRKGNVKGVPVRFAVL